MTGFAFDVQQATLFLQSVFPPDLGGHFLEFRFLHADGQRIRQEYQTRLTGIRWERVARLNAAGWSVTIGPGLRFRKGGKKTDVGLLTALWADIDAKRFGGDKREALRAIWALPAALQPSGIVDSGHGLHAWWWLDQPVTVTEANRAELEAILRGLQRAVGSDAV